MASAATSRNFFSCVAAPTPMLITIFCSRGSESLFVRPNFSAKAGKTSFSYFTCRRGVTGAAGAAAGASFSFFLPIGPFHLQDADAAYYFFAVAFLAAVVLGVFDFFAGEICPSEPLQRRQMRTLLPSSATSTPVRL